MKRKRSSAQRRPMHRTRGRREKARIKSWYGQGYGPYSYGPYSGYGGYGGYGPYGGAYSPYGGYTGYGGIGGYGGTGGLFPFF